MPSPAKHQLQHIRHHKIQYALCFALTVLTLFEATYFYDYHNIGLWLTALSAAALIMTPRFPAICPIIITTAFAICDLLPDVYAAVLNYDLMLALGIFAYTHTWKRSLILCMVPIVSITIAFICYDSHYQFHMQGLITGIINNAMISCIAVFLGRSLDWHRQALQSAQLQSQIDRLRQDERQRNRTLSLAQQLHDSTTGRLVLISLLTENEFKNNLDDKISTTLHTINDESLKALDSIRRVISIMNMNENIPNEYNTITRTQFLKQLNKQISEHNRHIGMLGFNSQFQIEDHLTIDDISSQVYNMINHLIEELFANIIRHADIGKLCTLQIILTDEAFMLVQSNYISGINPARGGESGTGLSQLQQTFQRSGGALHHLIEEDEWLLTAFIPINQYSPT